MNYKLIILVSIASVVANATDINPYGFIRFNGVWSDGVDGSSDPSGVFAAIHPYEYGSYVRYEKAGRFDFSAYQSTLGIDISDSTSEDWLILTGKFERDFVTGIKHCFINFSFQNIGLNILFGQTWSLFVPYDPPTINYQNLVGAGNLSKERPQIRITQKLGSIEIAAAARKDLDYPAVEGRIGTTGPIKIGTSAFYASEKTAGVSYILGKKNEPASWGIAADMFAPIGIVNISGEFFTGKNLSNYGGLSRPHYGYETLYVKSIGGWGALGLKASDNLSFNAGTGLERITADAYWPLNIPWLNMAIFANINYKLTKAATLALEYFRHNTEYMNDEKGSYNRIETAVTYEF